MNQIELPAFTFFRSTPENLISRPPLCSSLQSIETCFYLISIRRYPHALSSCASAIESAMKSVLKKSEEEFINASILYKNTIKEYPSLSTYNKTDLDNFRNTRNRITHYGFSPKDDEETSVLLLKTGFPFIIDCYQEFFGFDLMDSLIVEVSEQLNFALEAYKTIKNQTTSYLKYCFSSFAHLIRWYGLKADSMSESEFNISEHSWYNDMKYDITLSIKNRLEDSLGNSWSFKCPICDEPDSFICELDGEKLDHEIISLKRGICANCDLIIQKDASALLNMLCKNEINSKKNEILKDYGIL